MRNYSTTPGNPYPLGATWDGSGVNFALFSENGEAVDLCIFENANDPKESQRIRLREMTAGPRVDDAFSRFEQLEREVDLAEGRADALALAAPPRTLDEEIAELRNAEKIDAELEALKARLAASKEG